MSLADELLADLEEPAPEDVEMDAGDDEFNDIEDIDVDAVSEQFQRGNSVHSIAKLSQSKIYKEMLTKIDHYISRPPRTKMVGTVEADPEYQLIVEANNLAVDIDNEINVIHKYVRDNFSERFPELESLIVTPMEYMITVKELGNGIDRSKSNKTLQQTLTPATIMIVSVTASTTQGKEISQDKLNLVIEACNMAVGLNDTKQKIFAYVETRMSFIAPNLSVVLGASIAAKLMGIVGGLVSLSRIPACNILVLGAPKKSRTGFTTSAANPHQGYVYQTDLVTKVPPDLRIKAARLVAAKTALLARIDSCRESIDGHQGQRLREEIIHKLEKAQEPPPVKMVKALPAPIETTRKRRGGKRVRKMKDRMASTEVRKAANRMNFGEIEEDVYQEDLGVTLGTLGAGGAGGSGRVRQIVSDSKTNARLSKALQQRLHKHNQMAGGGITTTVRNNVAGTASVAFTPAQGLEIVNPKASAHDAISGTMTNRYFSSATPFMKVKKE